MTVLITGTAGFIGFHLAKALLDRGDTIIGLDSINDYYDVRLKEDRLRQMGIKPEEIVYGGVQKSDQYQGYHFLKGDIADKEILSYVFERYKPEVVCNLAAQAGVRYSLINPDAYIASNIVGFSRLIEVSRQHHVKHFVYASSSSVYGLNEAMPLRVTDNVDHPVSLYAATKKSNELIAHSYSHLFDLPTTGLRFFTVYGPWGRPDMALFLFVDAILNGRTIEVFNHGEMLRDFTYIDDITEGVVRVLDKIPEPDINWSGKQPNPGSSPAPYRIYNIGNGSPVKLLDFIEAIEEEIGQPAQRNYLDMQPGDVRATHADISALKRDFNYHPRTNVKEGIRAFLNWYKSYYLND